MNSFLFDASGLVKRYTLETGAALVDDLFAQVARERRMCLMLGAAEVVATLIRKRNGGVITPTIFASAMAQFRTEVLDAADFAKLSSDNALINASILLLHKHSINATDAILLQTTLNFADQFRIIGDDLVLATSDQRLLKAAQAEGLLTFDPETQSQAELNALLGP